MQKIYHDFFTISNLPFEYTSWLYKNTIIEVAYNSNIGFMVRINSGEIINIKSPIDVICFILFHLAPIFASL